MNWGKNNSYNKTVMHVVLIDEFCTEEISFAYLGHDRERAERSWTSFLRNSYADEELHVYS